MIKESGPEKRILTVRRAGFSTDPQIDKGKRRRKNVGNLYLSIDRNRYCNLYRERQVIVDVHPKQTSFSKTTFGCGTSSQRGSAQLF
ncbi:MAG: hypothetical protein UHU21_03215 [Lachnospiraceae bacterium]|jgi:hypothetical protein|nr:hypothetical protein [Lachnospiraceae bacterium]